jgi:hypothetical protein
MTTFQQNKLCIYGTRDIHLGSTPNEDIEYYVQLYYPGIKFGVLITGNGGNADECGANWGKAHSLVIKEYPANWKEYGSAAGPLRNRQMAYDCTHGLGLWDGKSRGTSNMATWLAVYGKPNKVVII